MSDKDEQIKRAKLAEQLGLYDDMAGHMKAAVETGAELSDEERNLMRMAKAVDARMLTWRKAAKAEKKAEASELEQSVAKEYREKTEKELNEICREILALLDEYLIRQDSTLDTKIYYLEMKAECLCDLAEVANGEARAAALDIAKEAYQEAFHIAKSMKHPVHLSLALNFSVFCYEILKSPEKAFQVAKTALDEAAALTERDTSYEDSKLIMQKIRDNTNLWTSDTARDGGQNKSDKDRVSVENFDSDSDDHESAWETDDSDKDENKSEGQVMTLQYLVTETLPNKKKIKYIRQLTIRKLLQHSQSD